MDREITKENDNDKERLCFGDKIPPGVGHVLDAPQERLHIYKAFERISSRYKIAYIYQEGYTGSIAAGVSKPASCTSLAPSKTSRS